MQYAHPQYLLFTDMFDRSLAVWRDWISVKLRSDHNHCFGVGITMVLMECDTCFTIH